MQLRILDDFGADDCYTDDYQGGEVEDNSSSPLLLHLFDLSGSDTSTPAT